MRTGTQSLAGYFSVPHTDLFRDCPTAMGQACGSGAAHHRQHRGFRRHRANSHLHRTTRSHGQQSPSCPGATCHRPPANRLEDLLSRGGAVSRVPPRSRLTMADATRAFVGVSTTKTQLSRPPTSRTSRPTQENGFKLLRQTPASHRPCFHNARP